jgi:hypothetical protein
MAAQIMDKKPLTPEHYPAEEVVRLLGLAPLEREGGFFRRSAESAALLPGGDRRAWSAIYALFTPEGFSALHRLAAEEIWFFQAGDPLESLRLSPDGRSQWVKLGLNPAAGERPQDVVAAGIWQGTRLAPGGRWALVSCVVAPEFLWSDFELGGREALATAHPDRAADIRALTR